MNLNIRSEKPQDYSKIAQINYEAFLGWHPDNPFVTEPILVDLLRHNTLFDPDLSLVAEVNGEAVGHVMFSPYEFVVCGARQKGVVLAPIAVSPQYQHMGIGGRLIGTGHEICKKKGFSFSLLCGHTTYYPRFGYRTSMFSLGGCEIRMDAPDKSTADSLALDEFTAEMEERPVSEKDVRWIRELWYKQHEHDALALFPGAGIGDWCNHSPFFRTSVFEYAGNEIGYARYTKAKPYSVRIFLAKDGFAGRIIACLMKKSGMYSMEVSLPATLISTSMAQMKGLECIDKRMSHKAFMICPLEGDQGAVWKYCEDVAEGVAKPGVIAFPGAFDAADGETEHV